MEPIEIEWSSGHVHAVLKSQKIDWQIEMKRNLIGTKKGYYTT